MYDGAQQRLVTLAMRARTAQAAVQAAVPPDAAELAARLDAPAAEATSALDDLSEPPRGIHPAFLAEDGLRPALKGLARRALVPVELAVRIDERLPEPIEIAAYYLVAETLTNTAKYAHASVVHIDLDTADGHTGEGADVLRVNRLRPVPCRWQAT